MSEVKRNGHPPADDKEPLVRVMLDMFDNGWFTETDGDLEAPTGRFGWTSVTPDEHAEVVEAFDWFIREHDLMEPERLIGNFVLRHTYGDILELYEYGSERDARHSFWDYQTEYREWRDAQ